MLRLCSITENRTGAIIQNGATSVKVVCRWILGLPMRGVVFTQDVMTVRGQQGRYAEGHGSRPLDLISSRPNQRNALHRVLESKTLRFDCPKLLEVPVPARLLHRRQAQRCRSGSRRSHPVAAKNG